VIASATGGLVELAARGAVLVPPGDARALAAAIDRSLAGPPPAPAEVGWRVAGRALDDAWGCVSAYAPGAIVTQASLAARSDRPAKS
jgi:glycosyltransferase involved in cell wall biosynthesis